MSGDAATRDIARSVPVTTGRGPTLPETDRLFAQLREEIARQRHGQAWPMPNTRPLVSVVVLNFNGEHIVRRCIEHLLAQSYPMLEIIVVDDASSDGSLAVLERYLASGKVSVVQNPRNLGVPAGRNIGALYARGDIVAFMDNDAYAHPHWLGAAVATLEADERTGAVASVVFFERHKLVLNGAGGTLNAQAYGGDFCFNQPYEFAYLPERVLYPMGCGMVVKKAVLDTIGPLDPLLFNYYDDVELGIRVWLAGFEVVVSPRAWVDHELGYSDRFHRNKWRLSQRNRIRTVLKYMPLRRFWRWLALEPLRWLTKSPMLWPPVARWWIWNLWHLPSALVCRARFRSAQPTQPFWSLTYTHAPFPVPTADNQAFRPDPTKAGPSLDLAGAALAFGWHALARDADTTYRWTERVASALVRLGPVTSSCRVHYRLPRAGAATTLMLRRLGELEGAATLRLAADTLDWRQDVLPCRVGPGTYEVLITTDGVVHAPDGTERGAAIAVLAFA